MVFSIILADYQMITMGNFPLLRFYTESTHHWLLHSIVQVRSSQPTNHNEVSIYGCFTNL